MSSLSNGNGVARVVIAAIVSSLLTAVVTAIFTLSSGNGKRDIDIVALQTTVQNLKETVVANHNDDIKARSELKVSLEQVQIDVARISEKLNVTASPGIR